ncbi:hypothetical protein, partial [Thalassobius sp. I31.1]|uniref:hypothetical protein n=1 Tax=Thalassobius sp. I31.1 TaxID=2109912 RepID=UPI001E388416
QKPLGIRKKGRINEHKDRNLNVASPKQEMNFADQGEMQLEERDDGDRDRLDLAVDDLGGLEEQLRQGVSS